MFGCRWGWLICDMCHRRARKRNFIQKLCGRRACKIRADRERWQRVKHRYAVGHRPDPVQQPDRGTAPHCPQCGQLLTNRCFTTDRIIGITLVDCWHCGYSTPLRGRNGQAVA